MQPLETHSGRFAEGRYFLVCLPDAPPVLLIQCDPGADELGWARCPVINTPTFVHRPARGWVQKA